MAAQSEVKAGAEIVLGPLFAADVRQVGSVAKAANVPVIAFSTDSTTASEGVYLLSFGPAYVYGFVYWLKGRSGLLRALVLAHLFELYADIWLIAGWMALGRLVRRKRGWSKTERLAEPA